MRLRQGPTALRLLALLCVSFLAESSAQNAARSEPPHVPVVPLDISSSTEIRGISEPLMTNSICSADNMAFMTRMVGPTGEGDIEFISNDGKSVIRFNSGKITDIDKPLVDGFFANESGVYLLVIGFTPQDKTLTLRKPDGQAMTQPAYTKRTYIARFRKDGAYAGSIPLDLPFVPMQFGAFAQGDFFFAGAIQGTDAPRAALVKASGQFDRFLELPGDLHARSESGQAVSGQSRDDRLSLPRKADNYQDTLQFALEFSMVVPDGPNLLLIRPGQQSPVFSVSPGGAVHPVPIEIPEGFKLYDLKASRNQWIAIYTRPSKDPHIKGLELAVYALNKATGRLQAQYIFPLNLGIALACGDGTTFTVLTREDDKLQLITLARAQ
jgi:hypothetical protein